MASLSSCSLQQKRFMQSYGTWMAIAELLGQTETVKLQLVCRYLYDTGVPRITPYFYLYGGHIFIRTARTENLGEEVTFLLKNDKATGTWKTIWNDSFGKLKKHQSIQVMNNLLTFGPVNERTEQVSMEVQTWSGLDFANYLRVESTVLQDMPAIWMFSLALHKNEGRDKIYITGGRHAEGWRSR